VLLVDVTHPDSEVSRLIHQAGHLNLHVEPGVRGGRHSFRFAKISTADTIHAEARGGSRTRGHRGGAWSPRGRARQDQLGSPEYGFLPQPIGATTLR
jgi:hypothetical protein